MDEILPYEAAGFNIPSYEDDVFLEAESVDVTQSCWSNCALYLGGPNENRVYGMWMRVCLCACIGVGSVSSGLLKLIASHVDIYSNRETVNLCENIKLELLTPAAWGGLMVSYNEALMQGRKLFWWCWELRLKSDNTPGD